MRAHAVNIAKRKAAEMLARAGIPITTSERERIEVTDFGLNDLERIGLQLLTYVNTKRVCAKELVLFPNQTCPEHAHPPVNGVLGKEETFRCRWGEVYLFVPGESRFQPDDKFPRGYEMFYSARHGTVLKPGDQFTIWPGVPHWFQAGSDGAIVSEFSTQSTDEFDIFNDPHIQRTPIIEP